MQHRKVYKSISIRPRRAAWFPFVGIAPPADLPVEVRALGGAKVAALAGDVDWHGSEPPVTAYRPLPAACGDILRRVGVVDLS